MLQYTIRVSLLVYTLLYNINTPQTRLNKHQTNTKQTPNKFQSYHEKCFDCRIDLYPFHLFTLSFLLITFRCNLSE